MENQETRAAPGRWFVLEGDWGGQIYASVPVNLVPAWGRRKRVRKVLAYLNRLNWPGQNDGTSVMTVEAFEAVDEYGTSEADVQAYADANERRFAAQERTERGVVLTFMLPPHQRAWTEHYTRLPGWKRVGWADGGMGGGFLLDGELWLHEHVLARGLDTVNRVRAMLGLPPLRALDATWNEEGRNHAFFCNRYLDHTYRAKKYGARRARVVRRKA